MDPFVELIMEGALRSAVDGEGVEAGREAHGAVVFTENGSVQWAIGRF
jgi:hypothetical protein